MRSDEVSSRTDSITAEESHGSRIVLVPGAAINAPVIEANGNVEQKGVASGKVKIEDARQAPTVKQHVVAKKISMHRPFGELLVGRGRRNLFLESQIAREQRPLYTRDAAADHRHHLVPPFETSRIGLVSWVIAPGHVHSRQGLPDRATVRHCRCCHAFARKPVDDHRTPASHRMTDFIVGVSNRIGDRNSALRKMLHEVEVKRQLLGCKPLKQRDHILSGFGIDEVVRVLDSALDAANGTWPAQTQRSKERGDLVD